MAWFFFLKAYIFVHEHNYAGITHVYVCINVTCVMINWSLKHWGLYKFGNDLLEEYKYWLWENIVYLFITLILEDKTGAFYMGRLMLYIIDYFAMIMYRT